MNRREFFAAPLCALIPIADGSSVEVRQTIRIGGGLRSVPVSELLAEEIRDAVKKQFMTSLEEAVDETIKGYTARVLPFVPRNRQT